MASNSIFAKMAHRAHLQRNAFDLSESSKFTASVGMLLPCFVKEVNPNEHFRINPQMFLRTVPMNSAAYVRLKQYTEFYFVPYRLLWRSFPQFIAGTSNEFSSAITDGSKFSSVPKWSFSTLLTLLGTSGTDTAGYTFKNGAVRLLDLLGYGVNVTNVDELIANKSKFSFNVSPFRMCAYQKIYSDFYRNAQYESINVETFSLDNTSSSSSIATQTANMMYLRYRDWKKDYFNVVSPSFQGADFMNASFTPVTFPFDDRYASFVPDSSNIDTSGTGKQGQLYLSAGSAPLQITAANIRSAFALDKLYRLMISAKDGSYSEQMKVRFGVESPDDDWKSTYLGGVDAPITISEVETTADTYDGSDGSIAGTLYGKGTSLCNGNIDFTAKEHGIIMGIFSILPECDYDSDMIDPFNVKLSRSDYFVPEFADLGKQPTPLYQFKFNKDTSMSSVLGWNLRYSEYKTAVDKVHGVFTGDSPLTSTNQSYNAWVAPRNQPLTQYSSGATVSFFKALPSVLNPIMVQEYDGTEKTDQFLVNANFNVQAIRPMSVYGEPSLN